VPHLAPAMIETVVGVENAEAILAHDAVDVVIIGPYDLSGSYLGGYKACEIEWFDPIPGIPQSFVPARLNWNHP